MSMGPPFQCSEILQDIIDWEQILKPLCTAAMWLFHVPAGGSTSGQAFQSSDIAFAKIHVGALNSETAPTSSLAKILIWSLRRDLTAAPSSPGGQTALASIQGFATLLEHYFHSSNSGMYSGDLAEFLSSLIVHLAGSRLRCEAAPYWRGAEDVRLDATALQPVTDVLFNLASVSIHHKSPDMQSAAAQCLSRLTYLMPDKCLPLVVQRLHESLDSYDAVHQIEQTINLCASATLLFVHSNFVHFVYPFLCCEHLVGIMDFPRNGSERSARG